MDWYSVFYWLTVADGVKRFFDVASDWSTFLLIVSFIFLVVTVVGKAITVSNNSTKTDAEDKVDPDIRGWELGRKYSSKLFFTFLILTMITWLGYVGTPSKKDCLLIIAGGAVGNFITSDSSAKQIPSDITSFLHLRIQKEISSLDEDARRELGLQSPKEKLLDKAKDMTKEQLIKYLESDTTLIKDR